MCITCTIPKRLSDSRDLFSIVSMRLMSFLGSCTGQYSYIEATVSTRASTQDRKHGTALQGCSAASFLWPKAAVSATCQADFLGSKDAPTSAPTLPARVDPIAISRSYRRSVSRQIARPCCGSLHRNCAPVAAPCCEDSALKGIPHDRRQP